MDVWISITGTRRADGETETLELDTDGVLERVEDGYRLTYQESETTGMAGVTTTLHVREDEVLLEHSGSANSLMVLHKGERHVSSYDTGYGCLMMGVYTRALHNTLDEHGGELEFRYTMDINAGMMSSHEVRIAVKDKHTPA